jgi:hypothetical protein
MVALISSDPQQPVMSSGPPEQGPQNTPAASMADDLSKQYGVPLSVVEDIINNNPGLTKDEYALLIQYYKKYGTYPFKVRAVFTGVDQKGNSKIYYITQGDIDKIRRDHGDDFASLSNEQLIELIQRLLQQQLPQEQLSGFKIDKNRQLLDYYYDDVKIDRKYYTIIVRTSTSSSGRVISIYPEW